MYAKIEPSGISVRRGAVQLRIDIFDDNDISLHGYFIQVSPDVTDEEIYKLVNECLLCYQSKKKIKKTNYKPFDVLAPIEELVFVSLRKGDKPSLIGNSMSEHLIRSAIKGLDIINRKDDFVVKK